jgi:hemerythrin-like metal-binding protein
MAFFTWKDSYSVGVKEMDTQHQKLVDIINRLYDAMSAGKGSTVVGPILIEMVEYTKFHFVAEEKLMTIHAYPGLLSQKGEHKRFVDKTLEYQEQLKAGKMTMSLDIMNFLKDWLSNHILVTDMKYKEFFKGKGVG